jgi:hypothetical protein
MASLGSPMPGGSAPSAATTAAGTGPSAPPDNTAKIPQEQAGYMELAGAQKDGDCSKVDVEGGVSLDLGCCNEFEPQDDSTQAFSCGEPGDASGGGMNAEKPGADHPLQQLRAKPKRMGL